MMVSRREIVGRQHKDHKIRYGLFSIDNRFLKPPVGVTNQPTHYWASRTCSVSPIQDTSNHTESGHVTLYNVWRVIIIMAPPSSWGWLLAGDCCWSNHTICKAEQTSLLQLHTPLPTHLQWGCKVWAIFWAENRFFKRSERSYKVIQFPIFWFFTRLYQIYKSKNPLWKSHHKIVLKTKFVSQWYNWCLKLSNVLSWQPFISV